KIRLYEHAWACLVEKGHGKLPGGTAQKWDWNIDNRVSSNRKIIIAGGLEHGNVSKAIAASTVFGVDVSSGVESSPGTKDLYKVKKFIQKVQGKKADW
ncbi:MAG: phosphoribosylanthranilate isomerase, partial [Desulfobacula sp.]|nr:phosphoribosylanthranilate isomerase [Desulfobacula sp.]